MDSDKLDHTRSLPTMTDFSGESVVGLGLGLEQSLSTTSSSSPYLGAPTVPAEFAAFDGNAFYTGHHHQQQQQHQHQQAHQQQHPQSPNHHQSPFVHNLPSLESGLSGQSVYGNPPLGTTGDSGLIDSNSSLISNDIGPLSSPLSLSHLSASQQQSPHTFRPDFGTSDLDLSFFGPTSPSQQQQQQQQQHQQQERELQQLQLQLQQQHQQQQTMQQFDAPLFGGMASPHAQMHHSPTPPHLLGGGSGSATHSAATSPSFPHFPSGGGHSRNISLGPEAAMLPSHMPDWSRPQFMSHRRSISEFSDLSGSALASPNMMTHDNFDDPGHSPLQQAADPNMLMGIGNFSLSDQGLPSPGYVGRSPAHSPIPSPRLMPQPMTDIGNDPGFGSGMGVGVQSGMLSPIAYPSMTVSSLPEIFPSLRPTPHTAATEPAMMVAPPTINVDYAPTNIRHTGFDNAKMINIDSLTPPDRGELGLFARFCSAMSSNSSCRSPDFSSPSDYRSISPRRKRV